MGFGLGIDSIDRYFVFFFALFPFSFEFYPWPWLVGGMGKVGWLWRDVRVCVLIDGEDE